jgi:hypothetical protein
LPPVGHPIWPDGAGAVIARRKRPVATSGQARTGEWVLRFERRTPPFIEPLMGWTGGDDTLVQIELTFRSRDEAIAYAERQGFLFRVVNDPATLTKAWPEHRPPAAEERRAGAARRGDACEKLSAADEAATESPTVSSPRDGAARSGSARDGRMEQPCLRKEVSHERPEESQRVDGDQHRQRGRCGLSVRVAVALRHRRRAGGVLERLD